MSHRDDKKSGKTDKRQLRFPLVLRKHTPRGPEEEGNVLTLPEAPPDQSSSSAPVVRKRIDPRKIAPTLPAESTDGVDILKFSLSPIHIPSLAFSSPTSSSRSSPSPDHRPEERSP